MKEETTGRLTDILEKAESKDLGESFIKEHTKAKIETFPEYFTKHVVQKELIMAKVLKKSGINKNYVHQIINGRKKASRDKIIALCIAAEMSFRETNRALAVSGYTPFYPKDERDARIAVCINMSITSVTDVNIYLEENGIKPLEV